MSLFADTLNRANGSLNGSTSSDGLFTWATFPGLTSWSVAGNAAAVTNGTAGTIYGNQPSVSTDGDDQFFEADLTTWTIAASSYGQFSLLLRAASASINSGYMFAVIQSGTDVTVNVFRSNSGAFDITLASVTFAGSLLARWRCEIRGSALRLLCNGYEVLSVTSTAEAVGSSNRRVGLFFGPDVVSTNDIVVDNIAFGDLSIPTGSMTAWEAALANAAGASANARLMVLGDSLAAGYGSTSNNMDSNARSLSWPTQLASLFRVAAARSDAFFGDGGANNTGAATAFQYDTRLTGGASWSSSDFGIGYSVPGGLPFRSLNGTTNLIFDPSVTFDRIRVYFGAVASGPEFTVNINGGASLGTLDMQQATPVLDAATINCTRGANTLQIDPTAADGAIIGAEVWDSLTARVQIVNCAWSGSTFLNWLAFNQNSRYAPVAVLPEIDPDLVIIQLGGNDLAAGVSEDLARARLFDLVEKIQAAGASVIVVGFMWWTPDAQNASDFTDQATFNGYLADACADMGVPFVDLQSRWNSFAAQVGMGYESPDYLHPSAAAYGDMAVAIREVIDPDGASVAQSAFRWRNDDGSETTATFKAAQNTSVTSPIGTAIRLRLGLQATDAPATFQRRLEYRLSAGAWSPVLPAWTAPSVTYGASGTSASGTTSCAPSYPSVINPETSRLYCVVTGRSNTASTAPTMPAGWTNIGDLEGGTGTWAADTGTRRATIFRKDAVDGNESGTVTVSLTGSANNTLRATIFRVEVPAGHSISEAISTGADTSNGTGYSATGSSNITWAADDLLLIATAQNIDTGTQSSQAISATNVTFGTRTNRQSVATTDGFDHRHIVDTVPISSVTGTPNTAPTYSYTISASGSGPTAFLRLRSVPPAQPICLAASSNIAASAATSTTSQLTGMSGTFVAGSISDDSTVLPTVQIGDDGRIEDEWCVVPTTDASDTQVYQFRVTRSGALLDSYAAPPELTIGSATGVDLAGDAVAAAAATGALTKGVSLAGAAVAAATGTGAITHVVPLAGDAAAGATASGALTHGVPLAGAALVSTVADGSLSLTVHLAGDAFAGALAAAQLTHGVPLAGDAVAGATATADLTVSSAGTADLEGNAIASAAATAALSKAIALAGGAVGGANAAALLAISVNLTGAAIAQISAAAALSKSVSLAGGASAGATATGALSLTTVLSGAAIGGASGAGGLTHHVPLAGQATAGAQGGASLLGSAALAGSATAGAQATGSLQLVVALTAQAVANALATGTLTVSSTLRGDAVAQALGGATLTVFSNVQLAGNAVGRASASGSLTVPTLLRITQIRSQIRTRRIAFHFN